MPGAADAVDKDARLLCGAKHESRCDRPTVPSGVNDEMRLSHEERSGPVAAIIRVRDHDAALEIADDTDYGLSSGVVTLDMQKAFDIAFRLEAGMVPSTTARVADEPDVPFGGGKNSGVGREGGRFSREETTTLKGGTVQQGRRAFPI